MRKGQPLSVGIQMWTCPPPDYWSGHGAGQPRAEAITSHELWESSLQQHEGLTGTLPAAVCRDCTVKARDVHCLSPSLRFPLTFHFTFLQSPLTLHPLCCCPSPSLLSPKQEKKKSSFPTLVSSLPSSDPGRRLLVKHSTEFRVKWLTQTCFDYLWWIDSRKTSVMRVI